MTVKELKGLLEGFSDDTDVSMSIDIYHHGDLLNVYADIYKISEDNSRFGNSIILFGEG